MTDTRNDDPDAVETVDTGKHDDVVSDPALADTEGADWASEGGATVQGAATDTNSDT